MKVKVINKSKHALPEYKTALSAGMDLNNPFSLSNRLKALYKEWEEFENNIGGSCIRIGDTGKEDNTLTELSV